MHKWSKKIMECVKTKIEGIGLDNVDEANLCEFEKWSVISKNIAEMDYYYTLIEAMKDAEYGEDYDEDGPIERRYYRGQPRNAKGQYMSRGDGRRRMYKPMDYEMDMDLYENYDPKHLRDMDRRFGRMYYTDGNTPSTNASSNTQNPINGMTTTASLGGSTVNPGTSKYDMAKRTFTDGKMMHNSGSQEDNSANMKALETIFNVLDAEIQELNPMMSPAEKTFSKQRITKLSDMVK